MSKHKNIYNSVDKAIYVANTRRPVSAKGEALIERVVYDSIYDTQYIWDEYRESKGSVWLTVLATIKEVIELVEGLNKGGIKGDQKKEIAMVIVEAIVDEQDIKLKILGIPIPGAKRIIKKYILKYADKVIDWLVSKIFTKKKKKTVVTKKSPAKKKIAKKKGK